MGQDKSHPLREDGQILSEYQITERNTELSLTYLRQKKTNAEFLLRELTFNELRQFNLHTEKLHSRKNIKHQHLTSLQIIEERRDDHLCSNYFKIYTLWEYPRRSLAEQIAQRVKDNRRFDSQQIRNILESTINAMAVLQQSETRHECLTTKAFLFDQNNCLKIADPNCTGLITNLESIHNNRSLKNIYLSPEQCQSIESEKPILKKNPYKNDTFTFAVILLECGLLKQQNQCYLDDCSRILWQKLTNNLNLFSHLYDPSITKIVQALLTRDTNSRPDWLQLEKHFTKGYQLANINQLPSYNSGRTGIALAHQTPFESPRTAFSYQQPRVYAGQQPTFTKYLPIGPGTLAMIPSVSNEGSSMYSQRVSHSTQPINPPLAFQNSYGSIPPSSALSPVGTTAIGYYQPDPSHRLTQTMSDRPYTVLPITKIKYQNKNNAPFVYPNNQPTNIQSTFTQPKTYQTNNDNHPQNSPSINQITETPFSDFPPSFNQSQNVKLKQTIKNTNIKYNSNEIIEYNMPSNKTEQIDEKPKLPLSSAELQYKSILNNSQYVNYSPNISNYIRPAQSINYETNKIQSSLQPPPNNPTTNQNNQYNVVNADLTQSPNGPENSQPDIQPQYVQEYFKLGSRYEGYKLNGMRHGKGKFYYQDGGSYEGQWKQNKMNGYGILYYQSNSIAYEGQWVNDRFEGLGKLYNQNPMLLQGGFDYSNFDDIEQYWQFYEGYFTADMKNGQGELKFSNGQIFEGYFKDDMVEGEGIFYSRDGEKIEGVWTQNHLLN